MGLTGWLTALLIDLLTVAVFNPLVRTGARMMPSSYGIITRVNVLEYPTRTRDVLKGLELLRKPR